jgi:hypothetical protein
MTTMANSARNMLEFGISRDPAPVGFELDFGAGDTYLQIPAALPHPRGPRLLLPIGDS